VRKLTSATKPVDRDWLTWIIETPAFNARNVLPVFVLAIIACASLPAHAVDGCRVMLCLAAPDWRQVQECVPTIHQLHRDLARGKRFPTCKTAGAGNSSAHTWANPPSFCPPQYTRVVEREAGPEYSCDFAGAVTVEVNGALWSRTWWRGDGDTRTEYSPAAKSQLGTWDGRFDADFAAWLATRPAPPQSDPS
jgi:hypothetical protein